MNNLPIMLTPEEMEDMQAFIVERFGESQPLLMHEIKSEYVHTDIAIVNSPSGEPTFVTFGVSARPMTAPLKELSLAELVAYTSPDFNGTSEEAKVVGGELMRLARYPFANDSWFGEGHTIDASTLFQETFGYDAFLFLDSGETYTDDNERRVRFLSLIPLYESERLFIMEQCTANGFLRVLFDRYGDAAYHWDVAREPVTAEEAPAVLEQEPPTVKDLFGVDDELFEEFYAFVMECAEEGHSVTEDDIIRWVEEHRP